MTASARKDFAVPALSGRYDGIELGYLDRDDEDDRRILIQAEHPELHRALRDDLDEIHLDGATISPRLHITMHAIVANQLWADDPPEVWETAQRLTEAGYDRHEVLHMLASVSSDAIYGALHDGIPVDPDSLRAALAALPASWEALRDDSGHEHHERHANRAERRAARKRGR